ncbi:MAG: glycosyltransferase [Acidobacteria bacterium]|nr:MAG: glycosyltransferase [Acidobacteriota bacterium]
MTRPLRILMYHRILDGSAGPRGNPSVISATPKAFREQMRYVARRYRALAAEELIDTLDAGRPLPRRAVLITFDDGCRDFGEVAWPILRELRLPATVFVPTAYPDSPGRAFWWDRLHAAVASTRRTELESPCGRLALGDPRARRAALRTLQRHVKTLPHADAMRLVDQWCAQLGEDAAPPADVLGWNELRALAADGVTIAPHTRTHPALTRLSTDEARAEIRQSADDVQREIGRPCPRLFAYPFGDHDDRIVDVVRQEAFSIALTCTDGLSWLPGDDCFRLRRTGITTRTTPLVFRGRMTRAGAYVDQWRHRGHERWPTAPPAPDRTTPRGPLKVAYIMSRFPKLSETFVLNELVTCAARGVAVEVYPLLRERQTTAHPEVEEWVRRAHFHAFLSVPVLRANAAWLRERPAAYLGLLWEVLRKTWGSANFFVGAVGIFPKTALFARKMREQGVTHVHAHFANHPALAAFIVHRLTGIPFSFTAHGSDLHVDRRMLDTKVAASAFTVTVSEFNREVIVRECGEEARRKVRVIHCGVDPDVFAPDGGSRPRGNRFQIVCVASFEAVKGHRFLVEACGLLKERGLPFDCHLVGQGPQRADVERRVASAGLGPEFHFHGGLPRPAVAALLSSGDAAVLASHPTPQGKREGIPVSLMEAMAAGLPVVASAISGIPELVHAGSTGLLVPSGDPVALADALERLAGRPDLRARMGKAGRARVMRAFNLHTNTLELVRLFSSGTADTGTDDGRAGVGKGIGQLRKGDS